MNNMFKLGDTVIFEPDNFNPDFWNALTDYEKIRYYGMYGYGFKLKLFMYICEHNPQTSHCTLMDISNGDLYPMCHISNFRLANDDEC